MNSVTQLKSRSTTSWLSNCLVIILMVGLGASLQAQSNTWQNNDGDDSWSNPNNWSLGIVPAPGHDVIIQAGVGDLDVDVDATVASLTFELGAGGVADLYILTSYSLTVNGLIKMNHATAGGNDRRLHVGAGTLTCNSIEMTNSGNDGRQCLLLVASGGTVNVSGTIDMLGTPARNQVNLSNTGTLNLGGTMTGGTLIPGTGSTVNYNGTSAQTFLHGYNYHNVWINNTAGVSLNSNITSTGVTGSIFVQTGTLHNNGFAIGLNASETFSVSNGATFNVSGTSSMVSGAGTYSFGATSNVNYTGSNQTVYAGTYGNLGLSGSGTKTFGGNTTVAGTLNIASGTMVSLPDGSTSTANVLTMGGLGRPMGTHGSSASDATYESDVFFDSATTGTITATTNTCASSSAIISGDNTICVGGSTNLTVSITGGISPYTVVHTGGTVNNYMSGDNISVSPGVTTEYTLTSVTDAIGCTASLSGMPTVTVNPTSVGGTVSSGTTVCTGTNSTVLTLSGHTGTIVRWESSESGNFDDAVVINNTSETYTATDLTITTSYRAVVQSGVCSSANSISATVTVNTTTVAGSVGTSTSVCTGTNSTELTLSGHSGSIVRWESSASGNFLDAVSIVNTASTYTATNLTATTSYRAVVQNGVCPSANSVSATVTVNALPATPVITGTLTTNCAAPTTELSAPAGYTYLWSNGATTATINAAAASGITVMVTDNNGCQATSAPVTVVLYPVTNLTTNVHYLTIEAAVAAADNGHTIEICSGTYPLSSSINVTKDITIQGKGRDNTTVTLSSSWLNNANTHVLNLNTSGITVKDIHFQIVGKGQGNIIGIFNSNTEIRNNKFSGEYVYGDGQVTRATVWSTNPVTGIVMDNNIIESLRQPGYINAGSGTISNNTFTTTRGWVIAGVQNLSMTGNTWNNNTSHITILAEVPNISGLTINNNNLSGTKVDWVIDNRTSQVLNATCNWYGTTDYVNISGKNNGPISFVPYLYNATIDPLGGGYSCTGVASPLDLSVVYEPASENIQVTVTADNNDVNLLPIPGNPTLPQITTLYNNLAAAVAGGNPVTIRNAAMAVGDDVIMEYYYYNNSNVKTYLQTAGSNSLIKNKYWQEYLVKLSNPLLRYPKWAASPPLTVIDEDEIYRTSTNPGTNAVTSGWLNSVLGRNLYVTATFIHNGNVTSSTQSVAIPAGPVNVYSAEPFSPATWVSSHNTIQAAINEASTLNGYYIKVDAGTYTEQINLTKSLTLRGPNASIAGNGSRVPEAIIQFPGGAANGSSLIQVLSNLHNVAIEGFDLQCQDATIPNYHYLITATRSSSTDNTEKWNNLTVKNNRFYSSEIPVYILTDFDAHGSGVLIEGNYINGGPNVNSVYNRGLYVGGTSGTIQDNVVENCNIAIQYMPYGNPNTGLIRRNTVSASSIGLYNNYQTLGAAQVTWEQNVVAVAPNPQTGLSAQVDGARTSPAVFNGIYFNTFGTQGTGAAPVALFQNNTINASNPGGTTSTVFRAVYLENSAAGATANLSDNSFTGYTMGVDRAANATNATVNATCNWWGQQCGPEASAIVGNVTYTPWLTSGGDGAGLGFQPTGTCNGGTLVVASGTQTNITTCFGDNNGLIDLTPTGGVAPYTYLWSTGATTEDISGLTAGNYSVTIIDNCGLTTNQGTASFEITQPALITGSGAVTSNYNGSQLSCNGASDGIITVTVSGGNGDYQYSLNGGTYQSSNVFSGLGAGTYTIEVKDITNCMVSLASVTITAPALATASISNSVNVICNGGPTGSATVTAGGGTPGYTYLWSNGATSATASSLIAGTYNVTVYDANLCAASTSVTLTEPAALSSNTTKVDVLCNGVSSGSIDLSVSGGTSPYNYLWSNGATTQDISSLPAGSYSVTINDNNILPTDNTPYFNAFSTTHLPAGAQPGTLAGTVDQQSGWTTRDAFTSATTVGKWDQQVIHVNDGNGNRKVFRMSNAITSGTYTSQVFSATSGLVAGETNAALWNNRGTIGSSPFNPAQFGAYAANNTFYTKVKFRSATGGAQSGLQVTLSPSAKQSTVRMSFLQIQDSGSGFNLNFYETGADGNFPTNPTVIATGLSYTDLHTLEMGITFVDGVSTVGGQVYGNDIVKIWLNGTLIHTGTTWETYYYNYERINPSNPRLQAVNALLFRVSGTAATANSGNGFYFEDFRIGNTIPAATIYGSAAVSGCTTTSSITITQPAAPVAVSTTKNDVSCNGTADGSIDLTVTGGTPPYSYSWSNGATTEDLSGLVAGTYTVVVTDANGTTSGCTATASATITEPAILNGTVAKTNVTCNGINNGTITVSDPSGGYGTYEYRLNSDTWQSSGSFTGLAPNTYSVQIRDAENPSCTIALGDQVVTEPSALTAGITAQTNVSCNGGNNGTATVTPAGGTLPYTYNWNNDQSNAVATTLIAGSYTVTVTDGNGCQATATTTITEPAILSVSVANATLSCNNGATTTLTAVPVGGTTPYTYVWSGSAGTSATTNALGVGSYTVTVTDANGCIAVSTAATVSNPVHPGNGIWYVNDNSLTGDGLTTAVGNNANIGTASCPFLTVSHAFTQASAGHTINIDAGIYNEPGISLNKAITLKGAQAGVDARTRGTSETGETVLSGTGRIFDLNTSGITMDGLYFRNLGHRGMDCYQNANNFTLRNCVFNVTTTNTSGGAIQFGGGTNLTANNFVFEKNLVKGTSTASGYLLYFLHTANDGLIKDNTMNSRAFMFGPFGQASGWQVKSNLFDGEIGGTPHLGYPINAQFGNAIVDGNTLRKLFAGMQISIIGGSVTNNVFDNNNLYGIELWGGAFGSPISANVTVANNSFTFNGVGTNSRGLRLGRSADSPGIDGSTILVNNNSFTDLGFTSGVKAIEFFGNNTVNAECNWWGTVNASTIASKLSAQIDYSSYRVDGTDTDGIAIGFQPASNTCTGTPILITSATPTDAICGVAGSISVAFQDGLGPYNIAWNGGSSEGVTSPFLIGSLSGGTYNITITDANGSMATAVATVQYLPVLNTSNSMRYATIQAAINAANTGDVINVCAGVYTEQLTVNKGITLNGANAGIPGNGTRGAESRLLNSRLTTSGGAAIVVDGFDFYQTDNLGIRTISLDGNTPATVRNNIIQRWGTSTGITALGVETNIGAVAKLLIEYNLFTGDNSGGLFGGHKTWNSGVYSNGGNVEISNNVFNANRTAINIDNMGAQTVISGNTFQSNGTAITFGGATATTGSHSISGNAFTTGNTLINLSNVTTAFRLDAVNNTFNGISTSSLTLAESFTIERGLFHRGRSSRNGMVTFVPNTQFVVTQNPSIQTAIDYSAAGGTIQIEDGTYTAQALTVGKQLDIRGQGVGTIIQNSAGTVFTYTAAGSGASASSRSYLRNVKISGSSRGLLASAVVNYLTLDGVNFDGNSSYAIHPNNTSGIMQDWVITNCTFNANSSGIYIATAANINGLSVSGSTFTNHTNTAFYVGQSSSNPGGLNNVTISGNTFTNNGPSNNQAAFYIEKLSNATISGNTMTNNGLSTNPRGIIANLKYGTFTNVNMSGNTIVENRGATQTNGYGINVQGRNDAPAYNSFPGTLSNVTISSNDISGFLRGVEVDNAVDWNTTTVSNNTISGCDYGILGVVYGTGNTANAGTTLEVHNNSITGSTLAITNANPNTSNINAECNWYGTVNGSIIASKISGTVDYSPWLVSGTDSLPAIGFQPLANACSASAVVVTLASQTNITGCFGDATGAIDITVSGGTGSYTYDWSNDGQEDIDDDDEDLANLTAGAYTVTVTDGYGSTGTLSVTITQPGAVAPVGTPDHVSCFNGDDASISLAVTGGTGEYTYDWEGNPKGNGTNEIIELVAGTYTVTVTDENGCTGTTSVEVNQPASAVSASISASTNVSCNGGSNGSATVTPAGGTPGYTYLWSNGATSAIASGFAMGTYTVTVTDINLCQTTASVTITEPSALSSSITAQTNVFCNGGSNGSATVTAAGGTPGYTYLWSNGATSATASGLAMGTYTVTVTDNNGCQTTASATITQPETLTSSITAQINVSCNGGSNGSATVTPVGGTAAYTYLWSNDAISATASGLAAGDYTVTVTDSQGCTSTSSVTITQPAILLVLTSPANGEATVTCGTSTEILTQFTAWNTGITFSGGAAPVTVSATYLVKADENGGLVTKYDGTAATAPPQDGGFTTVTWKVVDACMNQVEVSRTFNVLSCRRISGKLNYYLNNAPVSGINVNMNILPASTSIFNAASSGDGSYSVFSTTAGSFDVVPDNSVCGACTVPANQLNTLYNINLSDVAAIQAHVGSGAQFSNIYQRAAANVVLGSSGSQTNNRLTSADATSLTQAINGNAAQRARLLRRAIPINTTLTNGAPGVLPRSWGLVPPGVGSNPLLFGVYPTKITYPNLAGPFVNQDFVIVQVGDVVPTSPAPLRGGTEVRYAGLPLIWKLKDAELVAGEIIEADFRIEQMKDLRGWQFGLDFDPEYLKVDTVFTSGVLSLDADVNFGLYRAEEGVIRSLWAEGTPHSLNKGESVFKLRFTVIQGGKNLSEVLKVEDDMTGSYALTDSNDEVGILLSYEGRTKKAQTPVLYQNVPNPFNRETLIRFELPSDSPIELSIHDITGRLVKRIDGNYSKGIHEVRFDTGDLGQYTGILYYTLSCGDFTATHKMVVIE